MPLYDIIIEIPDDIDINDDVEYVANKIATGEREGLLNIKYVGTRKHEELKGTWVEDY